MYGRMYASQSRDAAVCQYHDHAQHGAVPKNKTQIFLQDPHLRDVTIGALRVLADVLDDRLSGAGF
jgi:hypothetical protein